MIKHLVAALFVCLGIVSGASAQNSYYVCELTARDEQGAPHTLYFSGVFANSDRWKQTFEDAFRRYVLAIYHENNMSQSGCDGWPDKQAAQNQKDSDMFWHFEPYSDPPYGGKTTVVDTEWSPGQQ
jgi:hypothetical protein